MSFFYWRFPRRFVFMELTLCLALGLFLGPTSARAQTAGADRDTLHGASQVSVQVRLVEASQLPDSMAEAVRSRIEEQLRRQGVPIVDAVDELKPEGLALRVVISVLETPRDEYVFCAVSMEAVQSVSIQREPELIRPATTWSTQRILLYLAADAPRALPRVVDSMAQHFAGEYHAANPEASR